MIADSAAPLKAVEPDLAADSSGFTTNTYARWYDAKYGREMSKYVWLKAHVNVGTTAIIVTSVEVTDSNFHDSPVLPDLLKTTSKRFTMQRVSADKGYLAESNVLAITQYDAEPFIAPKSNTAFKRPNDASRKKAEVWDKMLHYYQFRKDDFLRHFITAAATSKRRSI